MAFWGIEVKPRRPFTLKFDDGVRKRLHISQATLAIGASQQTSLVQCNVGDKSPVLLCALLPGKSESLQLNLEFDEDEEVLFSVIGPRGVHLTGFYTGVDRTFNDDVSESYGEDIENSENEESVPQSDEDEYEDSFIDDDDDSNLEVLPPSPVSADAAFDDDTDKQRNNTNTNKRLKKKAAKNIVSESNTCNDASKPRVDGPVKNDDPERTIPKKRSKGAPSEGKTLEVDPANHSNEGHEIKKSEEKTNDIAFGQDPIVTSEIDNDPGMNKSVRKKKGKGTSTEDNIFEADAADHSNPDDEAKKRESKTRNIAVYQDPIVGNEIHVDPGINKTMPKEEGKGVSNEDKILKADASNHSNPDHKAKKSEAKTNDTATGQDPFITNEIDADPGTNKRSNLLPSPELGLESGAKPKKKRKERSKEEKIPEANPDDHLKSFQEKKYLQSDTGAYEMDQDVHVGKENDQSPSNKIETGSLAGSLLPTVEEGSEKTKKKRRKRDQEQKTPADDDRVIPEKAAAKKKKQKSKVQKNDENMDILFSLNGEEEDTRTLSNGLVIKYLESSKSDGKAAALGRKLKVQYTAKLIKENGELIDSNGKAPYRFRLGDEGVMQGWNIGLDGMRAGDKRRLVVPPSLGDGSKGPVIYDVEVLSVH